jgi:SAM-dependent methyltransferase
VHTLINLTHPVISRVDNHQDYYHYLNSARWTGRLYRKVMVYPRLKSRMRGQWMDVGCGLGDFLVFARTGIGADVNEHLVTHCKERGLECHLILNGRLPSRDGSLDSVLLDNVLEHLDDPQPVLIEVIRVLRPGGIVVIGVPGEAGFEVDPDHKIYYDENLLNRVMDALGFVKVDSFVTPFGLRILKDRLPQACFYGVYRYPDDVKGS